jgi:hypothetical protein
MLEALDADDAFEGSIVVGKGASRFPALISMSLTSNICG